ncbi:hypothetical protein IAT38_004233 [Cryptococcus sp. DSM 104549]
MLTMRRLRRQAPSLAPLIRPKHPAASVPSISSLGLISGAHNDSAPIASTSRQSYTSPYAVTHGKGKGRAYDTFTNTSVSRLSSSPLFTATRSLGFSRQTDPRGAVRMFHATARREAIPLIPATFALLKGASVLTIATAFSRILISFFPVGTIAMFKMIHIGKWINSDVARPSAGPEAEEFYKMWCEDEKGMSLTKEESDLLVEEEVDDFGGITLPDGRVAYSIPMPPSRWDRDRTQPNHPFRRYSPRSMLDMSHGNRRHVSKMIRRAYFFIPPLPPASVRFYDAMPANERAEVDALRRYWVGLQRFKECFRGGRWLVGIIFGLPFLLILGAYIAGLERVPLTGRWRLILLTPEEEDAISTSLAGENWYRSVINLLTTPERPAPPIVPTDDWRWAWVQGVLSRLETAVLAECKFIPEGLSPPEQYTPSIPIPPPAYHPIRPRPRVSSLLHSCLPGSEPSSGREHLEIGPPYNIMLMEKDEQNAFSYGFGGKKAGGIVVYTGLLDSILAHDPASPQSPSPQTQPTRQPSSGLFGGLFSSSSSLPPSRRQHAQPTEEQTLHLACVLAHEMGHLLLSHHLETLSQQQVLWPSVLGLSMDLVRAFIWPLTIFLGPTVNDALANVGRTSTEELADRYGELGFQWKHEYEADLAGLRILARAGFDPRAALSHFSGSVAELHEIPSADKAEAGLTGTMFKLWTRATHPSPEQRTDAIKKEIKRWDEEAVKEVAV